MRPDAVKGPKMEKGPETEMGPATRDRNGARDGNEAGDRNSTPPSARRRPPHGRRYASRRAGASCRRVRVRARATPWRTRPRPAASPPPEECGRTCEGFAAASHGGKREVAPPEERSERVSARCVLAAGIRRPKEAAPSAAMPWQQQTKLEAACSAP
eukprot:scaffold28775_cov101-Isochrysis_galbana.AAC.2